MFRKIPKPYIRFLSTIVPAILIAAVCIYSFASKRTAPEPYTSLPGKPLAAFNDLYPVQSDNDGHLFLDKERFVKAVRYFSVHSSPKAVSDLVYLGNANNVILLLSDMEKADYNKLITASRSLGLQEAQVQHEKLFSAYRDIVNGMGQTFAGTGVEIVLHDTRNPLKSIVAIQNPISGRRLGDTNTNFGLELIKNYSTGGGQGSSFISYGLKLKDGRQIKSTTIPLFNDQYGLIGFICMNIDISRLNDQHPEAVSQFVDNFKAISDNDKINELIENSKRKKVN